MWFLVKGYPVGGLGGGEYPDQGLPGQPVYPSQGPGFPTNPIAPGGGGQPSHPISPGGQPPYPSQGPGFPTQPIAPGGGGGTPSHPIAPGGAPTPYPGVLEATIPPHPEKPDPEKPGTWVLIALPSGAVNWAWLTQSESGGVPGQELPESQPLPGQELPSGKPEKPDQGLPPSAAPKPQRK